jgi:hypothetical protein
MDEDQVLRSLWNDLEREDPRLAALLSGAPPPRRFRRSWLLLGLPLLGLVLLLPLTVAVGVISLLLVAVSPLAGCWSCTGPDGDAGGAAPLD